MKVTVTKNQEMMKVKGILKGPTFEINDLEFLYVNTYKWTEKWSKYPKEEWPRAIEYLKDEIKREINKQYLIARDFEISYTK